MTRDKMSPMQAKVMNLFDRFDKDVAIFRVYNAAYGNEGWTTTSDHVLPIPVRDMQQKLGPLIQRMNLKLQRGRIVPGELKQTYRMIRITKDH